MTHSNETKGDLMRPFLVEFLNFLTKSNGLEKTHRERIFVVELNIFRKYIYYIYIYIYIYVIYLFAAMACENLIFPTLNSDDTLQRDTRGFNSAFSR